MTNTRNLILGLLMMASGIAFAQPDFGEKWEEIEEEKITFISTRLDLTVEEGQAFWPVYNERNDAMKELKEGYITLEKDIIGDRELGELEDDEIEEMMNLHLEKAQAELDLKIEYHEMLMEVLPVKKVAKFYKAEEDFMRKLMEILKGKGVDPPRDHMGLPDLPRGK